MSAVLKLLRSMRFAIAILSAVAVAASTGSVLAQSAPAAVYVSQYGDFWAAFFALCGLTDVYHAWWFFTLLAFMATSTALCLWQNTPAMLRDMRSYRENKSLASLRALPYHRQFAAGADAAALQGALAAYLAARGFHYKHVFVDGGSLLAARAGAGRRAGYLLVHGAMVLICIGGLVDGNVLLRLRLWRGDVKIETRELAPAQVPAASRLPADGGSYRASMNIAQGATSDSALIQMGEGYLQQQLPFAVRLRRFRIDHYANGQPKDFASDIDIIDGARVVAVTLQVNHPYTYRGVTLFQSGFADGGSRVTLGMRAGAGAAGAASIVGTVGGATPMLLDGEPVTLEVTELRAINVFERDGAPDQHWRSRTKPGEHSHDVGPSVAFRLRDKLGQADAWTVYQRPVQIDGASYRLLGHQNAAEPRMRYLRLPADADGSLRSYQALAAALADPRRRARAAHAAAANVVDARLAATLEATTAALLDGFARKGFHALVDLLPAHASGAEELKIGQLYLQLLERAAGLLLADDAGAAPALARAALTGYDDALDMKLPALFTFDSVEQVDATGLQVTHAPGAALVYLGATLLALGVIAMYFIGERRIWLHAARGTLLFAFSANRDAPALQDEFDRHGDAIAHLLGGAPRSPTTAT